MISTTSTILLVTLALNAASTSFAAPAPLLRGGDVTTRGVVSEVVPEARDIASREILSEGPTHRILKRRLRAEDGGFTKTGDPAARALASRQPSTKKETVIISTVTTIKDQDNSGEHPPHVDVTSTTSKTTIVEYTHGKHRHGKHCPQKVTGGRKTSWTKSCTCKHVCVEDEKGAWKGWKASGKNCVGQKGTPQGKAPTPTTSGGPTTSSGSKDIGGDKTPPGEGAVPTLDPSAKVSPDAKKSPDPSSTETATSATTTATATATNTTATATDTATTATDTTTTATDTTTTATGTTTETPPGPTDPSQPNANPKEVVADLTKANVLSPGDGVSPPDGPAPGADDPKTE